MRRGKSLTYDEHGGAGAEKTKTKKKLKAPHWITFRKQNAFLKYAPPTACAIPKAPRDKHELKTNGKKGVIILFYGFMRKQLQL